MAGGRPLKFESPEELQAKIDESFAHADDSKRPYTLASLAYHLDCDTETLRNYAGKEEFFGTIKRAKVRIEASKAEKLESKDYSTAGLIFDMANNHGYANKQTLGGDSSNPLAFKNVEPSIDEVIAKLKELGLPTDVYEK